MQTALAELEALPGIYELVRICAKDVIRRLAEVGLEPAVVADGPDVELRLRRFKTTICVSLCTDEASVEIDVHAQALHPDTLVDIAAILAAQAGGN